MFLIWTVLSINLDIRNDSPVCLIMRVGAASYEKEFGKLSSHKCIGLSSEYREDGWTLDGYIVSIGTSVIPDSIAL